MKCSLPLLSALSDGDLPARKAARVRAHVEDCGACRRELAALEALRGQLSSLPAPEPPTDLAGDWLALQRRLTAEEPRARWSWRRWVLVPAFAAVAAAALVVRTRHRGPSDDTLLHEAEVEFRGAEAQYRHALDKLVEVTAHVRAEWPEARVREYQAARLSLDEATRQCREVARAHPADPEAEELLFAAYRKQIRFYEEQLLR